MITGGLEAQKIRLKDVGMPWVCASSQDDGRRQTLAGPVTRSSCLRHLWADNPCHRGWVMGAVAGELESGDVPFGGRGSGRD